MGEAESFYLRLLPILQNLLYLSLAVYSIFTTLALSVLHVNLDRNLLLWLYTGQGALRPAPSYLYFLMKKTPAKSDDLGEGLTWLPVSMWLICKWIALDTSDP